jgi:hypothetical protein
MLTRSFVVLVGLPTSELSLSLESLEPLSDVLDSYALPEELRCEC